VISSPAASLRNNRDHPAFAPQIFTSFFISLSWLSVWNRYAWDTPCPSPPPAFTRQYLFRFSGAQ
jgi:hypothetical protein